MRRIGAVIFAATVAAALAWWIGDSAAPSGGPASAQSLVSAEIAHPSAAGVTVPNLMGSAVRSEAAVRRKTPADAQEWQASRRRFAITPGLSARIQDALSDPTAAKLFHAAAASNLCLALDGLASSPAATASLSEGRVPAQTAAALTQRIAICREVRAMHGDFQDTFYKLRAARGRLDPTGLALLDAIDGRGAWEHEALPRRLVVAAPTRDPEVMVTMGVAWLSDPEARFMGAPVGSETPDFKTRVHVVNALALVACEADNACPESLGSFHLCLVDGLCTGTLRDRSERALGKDEAALWRQALRAATQAIWNQDFSAFE